MKKILYIILFVISSGISMTACTEDENITPANGTKGTCGRAILE